MFDSLSRWAHPVENTPRGTFLIVGLGNPGREYRNTRHNVGFMLVDALAEAHHLTISRMQSKALIAQGELFGQKLILAKPQTYMNLSGDAVAGLVHFYKIPLEHLLVAHDDLDLPLGTLRIRPEGGSAGQKGLRSIIDRLATQNFPRLRIGIGRPPGRMEAADYVLESFSDAEQVVLKAVLEHATAAVQTFVEHGIEAAMNQYNGMVDRG